LRTGQCGRGRRLARHIGRRYGRAADGPPLPLAAAARAGRSAVAVLVHQPGIVATTSMAPAGVAFNADALVRRANDQAAAALAALKPGFTVRELTTALNYQVINFAPGSVAIPAANDDLLNTTATALQGAPAGTVIEIGGHTDNTG